MSCRNGGAEGIVVCHNLSVTFVFDRTCLILLLGRASMHPHTHNQTKDSNKNLLQGQRLKNMISNREMSLDVANLLGVKDTDTI